MTTFNNCTAKEFWNLGEKQRLQILQAIYKGKMDYMVEDKYDSLPYGIKARIDTFLEIMENKRNVK